VNTTVKLRWHSRTSDIMIGRAFIFTTGNSDNRRSICGFVFKFGGGPVFWKSGR
jgi:hypothetical protein